MKYTQNGIECQSKKRPQDMKEGFRRVLQITITKWNLALWSKSVRQRLQEEVNRVENLAISEIQWRQSIEILLKLYFFPWAFR